MTRIIGSGFKFIAKEAELMVEDYKLAVEFLKNNDFKKKRSSNSLSHYDIIVIAKSQKSLTFEFETGSSVSSFL